MITCCEKKKYEARVQNMIDYVVLANACRSSYIANYFGDTEAKDCGYCDNCLSKKRKSISKEEFALIETQIMQSINSHITVDQLLILLKKISKEKTWAVLEHLLAEQSIHIDEQGFITKTT
jgi:ATP-dependent DNA helicase RecQ